MQITFNLPHVFYPASSPDENAYALRILLDSLVRLNLAFLKFHTVPALYRSGVRYGRTEIWDNIPALYERQYGDCKSLTAALVAEYRHKGVQCRPVFRFEPRHDNSGGTDYHILVELANGTFEDPSKILGMGKDEVARIIHR